MNVNKHLRWFLWGGLIGAAVATLLVILFRFTQSPLIFRIFSSVDYLGFSVAQSVSEWVFPGDRIAYRVLNKAVFFDTNPIPMKYMMKRLGILPNELHRLPMVPSTPELRAKLDGVLSRAGLI